ncbi:DNA adenine methylase [Methylorubrum sp. SL192]|uniref:DNA adenine methylase n=1 Tax=Methylorubrum sp. SL192 TaxID=2995167 RepID=UPI00227704AE|nr:DNA adenine methylase [Methylorubrum sp. SL192]MCY1643301.1 DNA adenine methylase [Methylorubrum sp. SL192]
MKPAKLSQNETGLLHFTPLRYPGGKGKLAAYVKKIIEQNGMMDGEYVEPFAGGAAIALELLFHEYVSTIHINDISKPVYAFWRTVLDHTEELCRLISDTPVTVDSWDKNKFVLQAPDQHCITDLGFAMFF